MASQVNNPEIKLAYTQLAMQWRRLAWQIEELEREDSEDV
jgi:hypothetical protein